METTDKNWKNSVKNLKKFKKNFEENFLKIPKMFCKY